MNVTSGYGSGQQLNITEHTVLPASRVGLCIGASVVKQSRAKLVTRALKNECHEY